MEQLFLEGLENVEEDSINFVDVEVYLLIVRVCFIFRIATIIEFYCTTRVLVQSRYGQEQAVFMGTKRINSIFLLQYMWMKIKLCSSMTLTMRKFLEMIQQNRICFIGNKNFGVYY